MFLPRVPTDDGPVVATPVCGGIAGLAAVTIPQNAVKPAGNAGADFDLLRATAILTPAGVSQATLTFEGSADGETWAPIRLDNAVYQVAMTATSSWIALDARAVGGFQFLRPVLPSNASINRTFTFLAQ